MLKSGGNVLLLDEPTNDLDVDTLRALEEALLDFAGCAVVISHDRWFLDRIATHILAFEGDSQVVWFEGNYAGLRGRSQAPPRRRRRPAAPHPLQAAAAELTRLVELTRLGSIRAHQYVLALAPHPLDADLLEPLAEHRGEPTPVAAAVAVDDE